jgi:MSHA biogenesis protein MshJ
MLNLLDVSIADFANLSLRNRILSVLAAAIVLYLLVNTALLEPQLREISHFKQLSRTDKDELAQINHALSQIVSDASKRSDQIAREQTSLEEMKQQIADVDAFFGKVDPTTSQLRSVLEDLLSANPQLALVSLKTLPSEIFYSPALRTGEQEQIKTEKPQKILYKHGVEISVRGNYTALLSYMENLQTFPKRLFWADASLAVAVYPDAVLKLVIYYLNDQPRTPIP